VTSGKISEPERRRKFCFLLRSGHNNRQPTDVNKLRIIRGNRGREKWSERQDLNDYQKPPESLIFRSFPFSGAFSLPSMHE
jgi:hypothetical protein